MAKPFRFFFGRDMWARSGYRFDIAFGKPRHGKPGTMATYPLSLYVGIKSPVRVRMYKDYTRHWIDGWRNLMLSFDIVLNQPVTWIGTWRHRCFFGPVLHGRVFFKQFGFAGRGAA
jgi:hypothetical protein